MMASDWTARCMAMDANAKAEAAGSSMVPVYEPVPLTWSQESTMYNGRSPYSKVAYSDFYKAELPVVAGEKYRLFFNSWWDVGPAIFLDASNTVLSAVWMSNNNRQYAGYYITIPEGCVTLRLQRQKSMTTILQKETKNLRPKTPLDGKFLSAIGDSITEKNSKAATNWVMCVADTMGCTIQNLGTSGTGFATETSPYKNRISIITSAADIIGVALSFNDLSTSKSVGDPTDTEETTLCGCANVFFDTLLSAFPTTPIIAYVQSPWGAYHGGDSTAQPWITAFKSICAARGIPFYDDPYYSGTLRPWVAENRAVYYVSDGDGTTDQVHPNSAGHRVIAAYLADKFAANALTLADSGATRAAKSIEVLEDEPKTEEPEKEETR